MRINGVPTLRRTRQIRAAVSPKSPLEPDDGPGLDQALQSLRTIPSEGTNGASVLLDQAGTELRRCSVPDGECIYSSEEEVFDKYLVDRVYHAHLNGDGTNELLIVFVHDHVEPCKFVVFGLCNEILPSTGIPATSDRLA